MAPLGVHLSVLQPLPHLERGICQALERSAHDSLAPVEQVLCGTEDEEDIALDVLITMDERIA